jgi:3-hydroxybutyryl-CoA dehydrogenase
MIEAVVEDAAVKEEIFRRADEALPEHAILASNTSSIPISTLAAATARPDRVIGMHFFNPVPVLKLVEVIRAGTTSDETAAAVVALARELGKEPVDVRDVPGFAANRILMPFLNEAVRALAEGVADAEAIDTVAASRLRASDGPPRARRPGRPRHLRRDHGGARGRSWATRGTRRTRSCASTSPRGAWPESGRGFFSYD